VDLDAPRVPKVFWSNCGVGSLLDPPTNEICYKNL
jgi:hypothetical protein